MAEPAPRPLKIFISYSHADSAWLGRVQVHLRPMEREAAVDAWDDTRVLAGGGWHGQLKQALDAADVAILLVSADFLASEFIANVELPGILDAQVARGMVVIPVIVGPSRFEHTRLHQFQSPNGNLKPLIDMTRGESEAVLVKLTEDIDAVLSRKPSLTPQGRTDPPGGSAHLPPINPLFTGRDEVLSEIGQALAKDRRVALSGMPGVGKTQTAVEFAHRHQGDYPLILWVIADGHDSMTTGLVAVARRLDLPRKDHRDQSVIVEAVKAWLRDHPGWLLILDNADDLGAVLALIPAEGPGHLLITTRDRPGPRLARTVELKKMAHPDGARLILRRADLLADDQPLDTHQPDHRAALAISRELDGLPLALDQAGAYIHERTILPEEYLPLYRSEGQALRARRGEFSDPDHKSVAITFSLAFEKVAKENPAAADLLRLCAFLSPESIPEEILTEGATGLGDPLGTVAANPLAFREAVHAASRLSLLRRDPMEKSLIIHRVVQAVLRDDMDEPAQTRWSEFAIKAVDHVFPYIEFPAWPTCDRLLTNALTCADHCMRPDAVFPEAGRLLNQTAVYLIERARYAEAEPLYLRALAICERALGPEHPDTARGLNNLAVLYRTQGSLAEAEPLYLLALAINERALGPEHPDTALSLNNLAFLYQAQGRLAEAGPLYRRALAINKRALGPEHPDTARSLNNLAFLYQAQGRLADAEPLYLRALAIRERALGPEHPDSALSINNLAFLYQAQGRLADAEPLYRCALPILEKALGLTHPHVEVVMNNLSLLLDAMGREAEASTLKARVRPIRDEHSRQDPPAPPLSAPGTGRITAVLLSLRRFFGYARP